VLYELTTGEHPFKGPTAAATFDALLNRDPPALHDKNLSPDLERIIGRALEKDRELRYQTASDLRAELKRWQRTVDSSPTHSLRVPARRSVSRGARPTLVIGGLALLLVVAAAVFFAWRRSR